MTTQLVSCQCKGRCDSRRCKCLKSGQPCGESCKCSDCQNPLNGMDVTKMSDCAIGNAETVRSLTPEELESLIPLPCGHDPVPLKHLIGEFDCEVRWRDVLLFLLFSARRTGKLHMAL